MPKVGLSTGIERREILRKAAYYIRSETAKQISSKLIFMPRVSPPGSDMVRTRGDAIRGILEELLNFHDDEIKYFEFEDIIICGNPDLMEGMDQFRTADRMKVLPIRQENLYEQGPWDEVEIQDVKGNPTSIRVNREIRKSKFRVSISVPSSDPAFGVYGALQNMIFAVHPADRALLQGVPEEVRLSDDRAQSVASSLLLPHNVRKKKHHPDRYNITHEALKKEVSAHRETDSEISLQYRTLYRNLAQLAEHVMPDLAYVDGTYVIDGLDTRIDGGFALSGDDPVAVDTVLAEILGMDIPSLGHLQYLQDRHHGCADPGEISVAVGSPDDLDIEFTPHRDEEQRLDWRHVRLPGENGEAVGYVPPEDEEETAADESEMEEGPDEQAATQEEEKEEDRAEKTETEDQEVTDSDTPSEPEEQESAEASEADAAADTGTIKGDSVRERVRQRLIQRGKLEGEVEGEPEPSAPAEEATSETVKSEEAEEEQGEEPEAQVEETEEVEAGDEAQETKADKKDSEEPAEEAADEPEDVRERIRHRLIRRGKLEGELPDGADVPDGAEDGKAEEDETTGQETDDQPVDESPEQSSPEKQQEEQESTDVRDRVEDRLASRDKLDRDEPEKDEGDSTSGEPSAEEPVQVDEVQEKVEVTSSSGPAWSPSDEVSDAEDILANLSKYDAEDKIRRRLAIRRQAVDGSSEVERQTPSQPVEEEVPGDSKTESESEDDQSEADEQPEEPSGEAEETVEQGKGEETGYTRDPDTPLRERVKDRLKQRGKLE